jgi:hypothetical protein
MLASKMNDSRRCTLRLRWILGLVILTFALALAACGGGGDEEDGNGGGEKETATATKTVEAEETETPEVAETKTPEAAEPSGGGGGGTSVGDLPVYPGADKVGEYSGDYNLPLLGEDLDVEEYGDTEWAVYESGDSVSDVAHFYRGKMTDAGWNEESWFDISFGEGAAWGSYTKNDGDNAAWLVVSGTDDKTEIVIGTGSK